MEFIDTHTHLFVSEFGEDRDSVVQRAVEAGVQSVTIKHSDNLLSDIGTVIKL